MGFLIILEEIECCYCGDGVGSIGFNLDKRDDDNERKC